MLLKRYSNSSYQALEAKPLDSKNELKPKLTLVLAFYNNTQALNLVLASLDIQSFKDFELIIGDDGSNQQNVEQLQSFIHQHQFPILHLWHEDRGFRKNEMLNWAIIHSKSDYLVFIDQDCILHPNFLQEHYENKSPKTILAGRRLDFSPSISKLLSPQKIRNFFIQKNLWWMIPAILWMKDNNAPKGIYIKNSFFRRLLNLKPRSVVGCNFSVHKEDLLAVNGFDMRYNGPGMGEDSDIEFRLNGLGIKTRAFCNAAVQYHIWHKLQDRPSENEAIFKQVLVSKEYVTPIGVSELINNSISGS